MERPQIYKIATYTYELLQSEDLEDNRVKAIYKDIGSSNYEVVIIRENKVTERIIWGTLVKFKPYKMPGNEDFGKFGWHFVTKDQSEIKYASIV